MPAEGDAPARAAQVREGRHSAQRDAARGGGAPAEDGQPADHPHRPRAPALDALRHLPDRPPLTRAAATGRRGACMRAPHCLGPLVSPKPRVGQDGAARFMPPFSSGRTKAHWLCESGGDRAGLAEDAGLGRWAAHAEGLCLKRLRREWPHDVHPFSHALHWRAGC